MAVLTPRQDRTLLWVIAANVVLLLVAPIGGMTLFNALAALLRDQPSITI